ncbi:DUF6646 family protein [Flavobacterium aciduliphilum]|jgi:hypothetical protein|uniref:Outer membrane protein with beta-barrel domain n=1 Tax=Flavobacterium aciduliphilum TaxID=1101402 RepID=A0A328YCM8_9FLAO|nr:DUF6646 family protein [Flavobacterium aciduliphilum]RAR71310.1 hypothetical protein CLV55_10847 [Flavobacterium aciduliphilum]
MKRIVLFVLVLASSFANAQAFKGKGDLKGQVGLNLQSGGSGISVMSDFGLGSNMSVGFLSSYMLNANTINNEKPRFGDRIDVKFRFNANIGDVFHLPKNVDVYPGLNLGLRNFGGHLGGRYFFTQGFGLFAETSFPLASYDSHLSGFDYYNNQFEFHIGASFNL